MVLDSIRAVRNRLPAEFGHSRFAPHGYSGGAIATRGAAAAQLRTGIGDGDRRRGAGRVPADYRLLARSMYRASSASI